MALKRPTPVDSKTYDRFIAEVARRSKGREGAKKEALEEAMKLWIQKKK